MPLRAQPDFETFCATPVLRATSTLLGCPRSTAFDKYYPSVEAKRLQPDVLLFNIHRSSPGSEVKLQHQCVLTPVVRYMECDYGLRVSLVHEGSRPKEGHWTTVHYAKDGLLWTCSDNLEQCLNSSSRKSPYSTKWTTAMYARLSQDPTAGQVGLDDYSHLAVSDSQISALLMSATLSSRSVSDSPLRSADILWTCKVIHE